VAAGPRRVAVKRPKVAALGLLVSLLLWWAAKALKAWKAADRQERQKGGRSLLLTLRIVARSQSTIRISWKFD
jgi:hypothetical protein